MTDRTDKRKEHQRNEHQMATETKPQRTFAQIIMDRLEYLWAETDRRKAAKATDGVKGKPDAK